MKNNLQTVGLHITGNNGGNSRRGGKVGNSQGRQNNPPYGSRVSPYIKPLGSSSANGQKLGNKLPGKGNNANTDSELYVGKSGPALHVK